MKSEISIQKAFKSSGAASLFLDYTKRISRFSPCTCVGGSSGPTGKEPGTKVWICDRGIGSKVLSSEELSDALKRLLDGGVKRLEIVIGGPDGLSPTELEEWRPDLKWSFGPMTLPHEVAAVVAGEQIYRAWTILKSLPYHTGH